MTDQSSGSVFTEQTQTTQSQEETQTEQTQETETAQTTQQPNAQSDNLWADQLASIKNESGESKYKDVPTALEALKHSQEYIPTLKSENETLKQEIEQLKTKAQRAEELEQTLDRLSQQPETPSEEQPTQGLTAEQLQDLLEQKLSEREKAQAAQQNSQEVEQAIRQAYGEKSSEVVAQKAKEYGMTAEQLGQWAASSPKAVMALFEVKSSAQGGKPSPNSSVNIPPVAPNNEEELPKPKRSVLGGASSKEQAEYMAAIRRRTNQRLGVET